jgi:hypothetical protein
VAIVPSIQKLHQRRPACCNRQADGNRFPQQIGELDPVWHHIEGAQELPLNKLVEKCANRSGRLTNRTINSYIHALSGVFRLAGKEGHFEGRNPFVGRTLEEANSSWRSYKTDELNKLFSTSLLRNMPTEQRICPAKYRFENAMAWIPLVGLFSGMQICQMRTSDVQRKEGIWLFNVSDENSGQRLKTEAATRIVPIHSELVRCGFLDYVLALPRNGQLFPALKPGGPDGKYNHYFAKRFTVPEKVRRYRSSYVISFIPQERGASPQRQARHGRRNSGVNRPRAGLHVFGVCAYAAPHEGAERID